MVHIVFIFADGASKRDFDSTFDAYVEVLNAFNQCEEYFVGALRATSKKPVEILAAETYVAQVGPIKEYLEYAAVAGFDDDQICGDIEQMFGIHAPWVLASWRKHMREYMKELEAFMIKHPIK
jgi:hypothetical protein